MGGGGGVGRPARGLAGAGGREDAPLANGARIGVVSAHQAAQKMQVGFGRLGFIGDRQPRHRARFEIVRSSTDLPSRSTYFTVEPKTVPTEEAIVAPTPTYTHSAIARLAYRCGMWSSCAAILCSPGLLLAGCWKTVLVAWGVAALCHVAHVRLDPDERFIDAP